MKRTTTILKKLFLLIAVSAFFYNANATKLEITAPLTPVSGAYDTVIVELGGSGQLTGNLTVNDTMIVKTGGGFGCNNFVIDGAGGFALQDGAALEFQAESDTSAIAVDGVVSFGKAVYLLDGTGEQKINMLPSVVTALVIDNPDTVTRGSNIEVTDSLVIHQGMFNRNGGRLIVNNDITITNHSTEYHHFTLRIETSSAIVTVNGTEMLSINAIDTQKNDVEIDLYTDMRVKGDRLEKASHIVLNGNSLILAPSFDWFSGYGDPNYVDFSNGGKIIRELSSNSSKTQNILYSNGDAYSLVVDVTGSSYGANAALEISYSPDTNDLNLGGATDYLDAYLTINPVDISDLSYDVEYDYVTDDIVGLEGALSVQVYDDQASTWSELGADGIFVASTNTMYANNLSDTAIISALTSSSGNMANLIITDSVDLYDTLKAYDTIWVQAGGWANIMEDIDSLHTFIIDSAGTVDCDNNVLKGINFELKANGTVGSSATSGFGGSNASSGSIRFIGAAYSSDGWKWYNGTTTQNIGDFSTNLAGFVIDNPAGVNLGTNVGLYSGHLKVLQGGFADGSQRRITLGGTSSITNNFSPEAFENIELKTFSGDDRTLYVYGDTLTYFPTMNFDRAVFFNVYTDLRINEISHNHRGYFAMNGADLILEPGTSGIGSSKEYPIMLNDSSGLILELDSTMLADTLEFAEIEHDGNAIGLKFNLNEGVIDSAATIELNFIREVSANQPDPSNTIAFYAKIDTMNLQNIDYDLSYQYQGSDIVGDINFLEAALYDGSTWDTTGCVLNTGTNYISGIGLSADGELAAGEIVAMPLPIPESFVPINNSTLVEPTTITLVNFDVDIIAGSQFANISITGTKSGVVSGVSGSISNDTLTISHADFATDEDVTVTIPAGAVANTEGKETTSDIMWDFSTRPVNIETVETADIIVTPTLSNGIIKVKNAEGLNIEVVSLLGKVVESTVSVSSVEEIDLTGQQGVFLIRVKGKGVLVTQKVVIN